MSEVVQLQQKSTVDSSREAAFGGFWVLPFGWLQPLSRVAVGRDQQLVRRVMSPPAQHHAGAEHAQHLKENSTGRGRKKTLSFRSEFRSVKLTGRAMMAMIEAKKKGRIIRIS